MNRLVRIALIRVANRQAIKVQKLLRTLLRSAGCHMTPNLVRHTSKYFIRGSKGLGPSLCIHVFSHCHKPVMALQESFVDGTTIVVVVLP